MENWRGEGGDGLQHSCQRKKARMWGGSCWKEGARAAEVEIQSHRGGDPGWGGPLISAKPPSPGLPLRFPSGEKAPLLLQHDL